MPLELVTIAIDAMGGDYAPAATVDGALLALKHEKLRVLLVGDEKLIRAEMRGRRFDKDRLEIIHAAERVEMGENPVRAIRRKKDASAVVAARLVRDGLAQGLVNAGNTGAAMSIALLVMGMIEGVSRPPIAAYMPCAGGRFLLLDGGANVNCKPEQLLQFAVMGDIYARSTGIDNPRIGLLNIGEEESKGDVLTLATHALLRDSGLNFTGNIEGTDMFEGKADVVICDGFVGNVVLKVAEGISDFVLSSVKAEVVRRPLSWLGLPFILTPIAAFRKKVDYKEYGGALLLGVKGVCVISHGRSDGRALMNALLVAENAVAHRVVEDISQAMAAPGIAGAGHEIFDEEE